MPPAADLFSDRCSGVPGIDRQPERGFRDQNVAGHDFERFAARIRTALVIAGHHPDLVIHHQTDLSRPQHVPCAVKGQTRLVQPELPAIRHGMESDVATQALSKHPLTHIHCPVFAASRSGVIGMGVSDQRSGNRPDRINPGMRCSAVKTAVSPLQNVHRSTLAISSCCCVLRVSGSGRFD